MVITLFGTIWILFIGYSFIRGRTIYMLRALTVAMVLQQPVVIFFGKTGIGPQIITSALFILWFVYWKILKNNWKIEIYKLGWVKSISLLSCALLVAIILMSWYTSGSRASDNLFALYVIQLCVYTISFLLMWKLKNELTSEQIRNIITYVIRFVAVIGIFQFINTCRVININFALRPLLYNGTNMGIRFGEDAYPWSMPRLFSTFQEPSYCSAFLVGGFYYLIAYGTNNKKNNNLAILVLIEIALTFSSTAYGAFALCGVIYLFISANKKALKFLIPLAAVLLAVSILSGQLSKIWVSVVVNKLDSTKSGSAWERNSWNNLAMESFYSAPVFGVGYKNCRASYIVYSVLGQLGIVGCITWIGLWMPCIIKGILNKKNVEVISVTLFLSGVICAMMIAIPDIDFCVFWLAMYLMALVISVNSRESKK